MPLHTITHHGATPDAADNASAVQRTIDACHGDGGGRVVVPAAGGPYVCGTITLRDRVELHLESGATLAASEDPESYRRHEHHGEYHAEPVGCLFEARGASNIAITGLGTIDGRGERFMDGWAEEAEGYLYKRGAFRPRMFHLIGCRGVTFRDVTLRDAAHWCLHMTGCDDVDICGIRIYNNLAIPNCDGIDPDACTNVRIHGCHIEAGDDCIVVKATREAYEAGYREARNILVSGCTLMSTSAAIKIGSESHGDFSDMVFSGCVVRSSNRGLAIQLRDPGSVRNILFSDMAVETRLFH